MSDQFVTWLPCEQFEVHHGPPGGVSWTSDGGVYIFAGLDNQRFWVPFYVGRAESLERRLTGHERWAEAERRGATHIHAKVVRQADIRSRLEIDLIQRFDPQMNIQHTP